MLLDRVSFNPMPTQTIVCAKIFVNWKLSWKNGIWVDLYKMWCDIAHMWQKQKKRLKKTVWVNLLTIATEIMGTERFR